MRVLGYLCVLATVGLTVGCGGFMTRMTAGQTASLFREAAPAFDEHWDYEFAGRAAPASLMQLEGVLRTVPDNEDLLLQLAKGYVGYAYGWTEDELLRVDPMDLDRADYLRQRARLFYMRARNLAFRILRLRADGFDEARSTSVENLEAWLRENFDDPEDAPALLWAGYAWGSAINVSRDDPVLIADLEYSKALIARSVALDEGYYAATGLAILAFSKADFPQALGGDAEGGRVLFERALELTHRSSLLIHVNYARSYAIQTQNRELYEQLLNEVIASGDINPAMRLPNKIARQRALWYLEHAADFF